MEVKNIVINCIIIFYANDIKIIKKIIKNNNIVNCG